MKGGWRQTDRPTDWLPQVPGRQTRQQGLRVRRATHPSLSTGIKTKSTGGVCCFHVREHVRRPPPIDAFPSFCSFTFSKKKTTRTHATLCLPVCMPGHSHGCLLRCSVWVVWVWGAVPLLPCRYVVYLVLAILDHDNMVPVLGLHGWIGVDRLGRGTRLQQECCILEGADHGSCSWTKERVDW